MVSTVARHLLAMRTTPPASVCLAEPALVVATSPSIPVFGVTAPPVPVVATPAVPHLGECLLEPFKKDGPLGKKGECLTNGELRSRSRLSFQSFAWGAITEGTKRLYNYSWEQFVKFCAIIGLDA